MWGKGIITNIQTLEEAIKAYKIASQYKGSHVIIEEHVQGDDHRILILNGNYIAGLRRTAPFVIGDGINSIIDLIRKENERRKHSDAIIKNIMVDATLEECLQLQSVSMTDVIEKDKKIFVRMTGNICSGGISENITTQVHPSIIETCKTIGACLNMKLLGVDIITTDISKPFSVTNAKVTEVNENPDILMHTSPYIGEAIDTTQLFIDYLYPDPTEAWIDITVNGNILNKREKLEQYLDIIPKQVSQFENFNTKKVTFINSPDKPLQQYLLDVRTTSIIIS
jgi:cyanophycin synthetase